MSGTGQDTEEADAPTVVGWIQPRPFQHLGGDGTVVGRDREITAIRHLLAGRKEDRAAVVVILGDPGSGKSAVVDCVLATLGQPVTRMTIGDRDDHDSLHDRAEPAVLVVEDADRIEPGILDAVVARATGRVPFRTPIVVTARPDGPAARALAELPTVTLAELGLRPAREILARHATAPVSTSVADRLIEATGANPQALRHLASSLSADQLTGQRPVPYPPDIGARLVDALGCVRAVDPQSRMAGLVVAAGQDRTDAVVEAICRMGLDPAGVPHLGPLYSCALYHSATVEERRRAHELLAAACRELGHVESEAWHLLRSTEAAHPDTADRVDAAAELAWSQHRLVEAGELYAGAARLTQSAPLRAERLMSAATAWMAVGRTDAAARAVEETLGTALPLDLRSRACWLRGRNLLVTGQELDGRRYLIEQASVTAVSHPEWAVRMAAAASASALRSGRFDEAVLAAEEAVGWSSAADEISQAMARLVADSARLAGGERRGVKSLVAGLEEVCRSERLLMEDPMVAVNAALSMIWVEEHEAAGRVLEQFEMTARRAGAHGALAAVLTVTALLRHRACDPTAAELAALEACQLASMTSQPTVATIATAVLAIAEAILGRAERCRIRCARLLERASAPAAIRASALAALGLLELGEGRPGQAIRWLEVLAATPDSAARSDPGFMMWRADLVDAYRQAGETERAWAVLADMEASGSRRTGKGRTSAAITRCRATLCDDEQAGGLYREALQFYQGPVWRFARARTELSLGQHLHRIGDQQGAEAALGQALALFREIGAKGWERQALDALDQLGVRPERPSGAAPALSPAEHQVAMAASLGASPADISAGLGIPDEDVEGHLASALEKLGVPAGRLPELAAELASRAPAERAPAEWAPAGSSAAGTDAGAAPTGRIRLLGEFEIDVTGVDDPRPTGTVGLAVKIVALSGRMPTDELICELWPEADPDAGRNRLRTLLSRLRQRCGPILTRTGDRIGLAPGIETDAQLFEAAALAALTARAADDHRCGQMARDALELYRGELLAGDREVARAVGLRERLRRRHLEVLYLAAQDSAARGNVDEAVGLLEDAIVANRHDEGPYVRAASVLREAGRTAEALSVLRRAKAALNEIGLSLSPSGQKIERSLLSGQYGPD